MKVTKRQNTLRKESILMYKTDFKKPIMKPKPQNPFLNPTKPWFHFFTPPSPINYHEYSTPNSKHCYVKLRFPNKWGNIKATALSMLIAVFYTKTEANINASYTVFCWPFFPISDLWMCGITPVGKDKEMPLKQHQP